MRSCADVDEVDALNRSRIDPLNSYLNELFVEDATLGVDRRVDFRDS